MTPPIKILLAVFLSLVFVGMTQTVGAAEPSTGPVFEDFGPVYEIADPAHLGDPADGLRAVFDVVKSPEDPAKRNPSIETVARFLNLHVRAGFPRDRLEAVLVLHGPATEDTLTNAAYRRRHDVDNPNLPLLEALRAAGVKIYICGQSAAYRGFESKEIAAPVETALSAMTALIQAQDQGYRLIAF